MQMDEMDEMDEVQLKRQRKRSHSLGRRTWIGLIGLCTRLGGLDEQAVHVMLVWNKLAWPPADGWPEPVAALYAAYAPWLAASFDANWYHEPLSVGRCSSLHRRVFAVYWSRALQP